MILFLCCGEIRKSGQQGKGIAIRTSILHGKLCKKREIFKKDGNQKRGMILLNS